MKFYHERDNQLSEPSQELQPEPQEIEVGDVSVNQRDKGLGEEDNSKLRMEESVPVTSSRPVRTQHVPKKLEDCFVLNIWNIDL